MQTVTLEYPFEFDGQKISSLTLCRPTVGDNLAVQKAAMTDAEREIRLLANLAEVTPETIHRMDLKDWGPPTAGFPSPCLFSPSR